MPTRRVSALWMTGLLLAMWAGAGGAQQAGRIEPRDQLKITVFNMGDKETSLSGSFLVDADGTFAYPTGDRIRAMGLTTRELETDLTERLKKSLVGPQVAIEIESTTSKTVTVNGEVKMPMAYQFSGQVTLFSALTRAGSPGEHAGDDALIHRRHSDGTPDEVMKVDISDMFSGRSMENDIVLRDGDIVIVPASEPVTVSGEVRSPGRVFVKRNTTVLAVLSMAGGPTDRAATGSIEILRTVEGQSKQQKISVKDLKTDLVKPGDQVIVHARMF